MSIFTERQALKEYTEWLREERRRLGQEYWKAMERLKAMDENATDSLVLESNEIIDKLTALLKVNDLESIKIKPIEKEEKHFSPQDIEKEKDKDKRRRKNNDISLVAKLVLRYLREKAIPVSLKEIDVFLKSNGINVTNPTSTMDKIRVYEPGIKKAYRGYYQGK